MIETASFSTESIISSAYEPGQVIAASAMTEKLKFSDSVKRVLKICKEHNAGHCADGTKLAADLVTQLNVMQRLLDEATAICNVRIYDNTKELQTQHSKMLLEQWNLVLRSITSIDKTMPYAIEEIARYVKHQLRGT